jgi:hypothetical protein
MVAHVLFARCDIALPIEHNSRLTILVERDCIDPAASAVGMGWSASML